MLLLCLFSNILWTKQSIDQIIKKKPTRVVVILKPRPKSRFERPHYWVAVPSSGPLTLCHLQLYLLYFHFYPDSHWLKTAVLPLDLCPKGQKKEKNTFLLKQNSFLSLKAEFCWLAVNICSCWLTVLYMVHSGAARKSKTCCVTFISDILLHLVNM